MGSTACPGRGVDVVGTHKGSIVLVGSIVEDDQRSVLDGILRSQSVRVCHLTIVVCCVSASSRSCCLWQIDTNGNKLIACILDLACVHGHVVIVT